MANTENLDPDDNNAYLVYIPAAIFVVISPSIVGLRVWARLRGSNKMGADDYTVIAALVFTLLLSGFLVGACQHGMGRHIGLLEAHEKQTTLMLFWLAQISYKAAINLSKACIVLLYLRVFTTMKWFRFGCWFMLSAVTAYMVAAVFATIFQCSPVQLAFNKTLDGHCIDNTKFWYANAGFSIASDIIILLLPMPLVYQLQVRLAQKLALGAVFTLGIFVVITSCLRITTLNILATTPDTTYDITNVMWTIIEPNIAIICACLPTLRHLIIKIIPGLRSKSSLGYNTASYGNKSSRRQASQNRDAGQWLEIGDSKTNGIAMSTLQRNNSEAGSEENILENKGRANAENGIQKTVEYTVFYSDKS